MGIPYDITFHPKWWHKNAGVSFDKEFFFDNDYRIEADIRMRRILYEKFGEFGVVVLAVVAIILIVVLPKRRKS
jgi:hypothetical protein